jgi:hypothetical protein
MLMAAPAHSQVIHARLGLTGATDLVTDRITQEITVRQNLAPTLLVGASLPVSPTLNAGLEVSLGTGGLDATEGGASTDLGTLRTAMITVGLEGPLVWQLRWRGGVGVLKYWPSNDTGIFLLGGPTDYLLMAGADYRRALNADWSIVAGVRYDYHRFTTDALEARGFSQSQQVHRVGLLVGVSRTIS